eukprot:2171459-Pleurochrysis_carterae.AAC.2
MRPALDREFDGVVLLESSRPCAHSLIAYFRKPCSSPSSVGTKGESAAWAAYRQAAASRVLCIFALPERRERPFRAMLPKVMLRR